ncbi:DNA polymerase III subunit delta' [Oceanomicrobium pacificus]|uniref:DNA polymerase III subunit delta n=1 Tax=Oceanomicrobium pacificus TaxID=2692916 RepID=A0A6B0TM86_9RHOB|nr:DNA polymerase III subunit delta' [Oceanomicrobium pacificus]MXU65667.1 DNA polymerase III subunit delta' [Oceanomicrobium pacificus]
MSIDVADIPEPDRIEGAPHPRHTVHLFGQTAAEAAFLDAFASGRLPHGWLISGPKGIGKATLAWRIARFLRDTEARRTADPLTLDTPPDSPVFRLNAALSDPGVHLCRRLWDHKKERLTTVLTVEAVRELKGFFSLTAPDGGWRVAIIDSVDEMNESAANALLKVLEEPPEKTVLLLISHQPARLLPTIRSRCRALRLDRLDQSALGAALDGIGLAPDADSSALAELTGGSVGSAIRLLRGEGLGLYSEIIACLADPAMPRGPVMALARSCAGVRQKERYALVCDLLLIALSRAALAASGAGSGIPAAAREERFHAISAHAPAQGPVWAAAVQRIDSRLAHARAVNLDPEQVILDTFISIEGDLRRAARAAPVAQS